MKVFLDDEALYRLMNCCNKEISYRNSTSHENNKGSIKLEMAKKVVGDHIGLAPHGIYDSRNIAGDHMCNLFCEDDLSVDVCREWEYFEVLGLTDAEFEELREHYGKLLKEHSN